MYETKFLRASEHELIYRSEAVNSLPQHFTRTDKPKIIYGGKQAVQQYNIMKKQLTSCGGQFYYSEEDKMQLSEGSGSGYEA